MGCRKKAKKAVIVAVQLVGCTGVGLVGVAVDVPAMCTIAIAKCPILLAKGWKQQITDMQNCVEKGCPRPLCFPMTALLLVYWPVRVVLSLGSAAARGFVKGMYSGVVAYKEKSLRRGFNHLVAAISKYDEYTNDLMDLRKGSCLPRPNYHRKKKQDVDDSKQEAVSLRQIGEYNLERLFEFMKSNAGREKGRLLLEDGLLEENKLSLDAVTLTILYFLMHSATQSEDGERDKGSSGFVLHDSLMDLECQIRAAKLDADEIDCLVDMVLCLPGSTMEMDPIRRGTLQGFGRRIRGIAKFVSASPEFRECYSDYVDGVLATCQDMISFD